LPTGSKKQYQESIEKYKEMLNGLTIYPGHGESYNYN
jgi:glyoxylase-like metal-dependent hydrolase (beta-lactamase superfamily II)